MQQAVKMCLFVTVAACLATMWGAACLADAPPASRPDLPAELASLASSFDVSPAVAVSEHFLVVHDVDNHWAEHAMATLERTYQRFFCELLAAGLSPEPPTGRLVWLCFAERDDFDRYVSQADRMNLSHLDAYYSSRTNRIAICLEDTAAPAPAVVDEPAAMLAAAGVAGSIMGESDGDRRLAHEAAHQLSFNCGLLRRGVMYPLWVSEGFATHFESAAQQQRSSSPHSRRLSQAVSDGRATPFGRFLIQTRPSTDEAAKDYAQAWGMFSFLLAERPTELKAYLRHLSQLSPGPRDASMISREFTAMFGAAERVEPSWQAFLKSLPDEKVEHLAIAPAKAE